MLALVVALVGPLFVDWTSYRAAFEREASQALGQPVRVLGSADMQILPIPHLYFESVHVGPDDQSPILVVDEFDMRIELMPLLQGTIEVVDMTLRSPTLRAKLDEQGRFDWQRDQGRLWELDLEKIRLNDVRIENGRIEFEDRRTGRQKVINGLNGNINARSLIGPYKIETSFRMDGEPYSLSLSTGSASAEGMRLKSLLTPVNLPVVLSIDGDVTENEDGQYHYVGKSRLTNQIDGLEDQITPWELTGTSDLTVTSLVMPKLDFSHGQVDQAYRLSGAATIDFGANPRFDVVVSSRQLDLDRALGDGPNAPINLQGGVSKLAEALTQMPLPPMPGRVGFDVPGVILGGGIIRNLQLDASLVDNGWQIETLEADLPGQTRYAMAGLFSRRVDRSSLQHAFEGEARIRSDQPTAFAKWWLKDAPSNGRLEPFDLSGQVVVKSDRISVFALDLDMDGDRASGQIDWFFGDGSDTASGALSVKLDAERIDLDAVQGIGSLLLSNSTGDTAPLRDIDLDIKTDRFVQGEFEGQTLAAKIKVTQGTIDIDTLTIEDFAGTNLSTSGILRDLATSPSGRLAGELKADNLNGIASLVARLLPEQPVADWFSHAQASLSPADVSFSIEGGGGGNGLNGSLNGMLGGGKIVLGVNTDGALANWADHELQIDAQIDNPDGQKLLGLVGLGRDVIAMPGLTAEIALSGVPAEGSQFSMSLKSGDGDLVYDGTARYNQSKGVETTGVLTLQTDDFAPFLMATGVSLTNPGAALPVSLKTSVHHVDGVSNFSNLEGQWDGQPIVGTLSYENTITDRLLKGRLELGDVDGIWLGETIVGAGRLTAIDRSWPDEAFVAPLPNQDGLPLKIDLKVKARSLELTAPYIFQQPEFGVIWREDSLVLSDFSALLEGGTVTGGLQLETVNGEAVLKSHMSSKNTALAPFIWQRDGRSVAKGLLDVNFNIETQGRSMAGLVSGLSGNGTFALKDAVLNYINPEAFELVVRAVDAGLELKDDDISNAFVSHMDAGSTKVYELAGAFRLAGGALRANNIEAEAEILQSRGNLMLDFSAQTINGDWSIKVEPNEEDAVTGAQPEVGLVFNGDLAAPQRVVDVAPFTGYLSIRAFEREVDRVERLQADILEKERMRRLLRVYRQNEKRKEAERIAAEEAAILEKQRAAEEAIRLKEEAKRKAAEEKKRKQEEAKRKAAEEKARREAEVARKAEEARLAEEARKAEAARIAEEKRLAEQQRLAEEARKAVEEQARLAAEAKRRADEQAAKLEAARKEAERLAAEARQAEQAEQELRNSPQNQDDTPVDSDAIEVRPLEELTPSGSNDQGVFESDELGTIITGTFDPQPIRVTRPLLPEALFTLPKNREKAPETAAAEQGTPATSLPEPDTFNELIEQLRNSPDRIIQLD